MVRKARTTRITRELSVFLDMRSTVLVAGFALLSGAQCEFPEDASAVDVSWKGYTVGNYIPDILPLTSLRKLNVLSLSCNSISSVRPLETHSFPKLRVLDLSYNNLSGRCLTALQQLDQLQTLSLSGNDLSDMTTSDNMFYCLKNLVLSNCRLQSHHLPCLRQFPRLQHLTLTQNSISPLVWDSEPSPGGSETPAVCPLTALMVLDLSRNPLKNACTLASVSFVPTLLLQGTPLQAFTRQDEIFAQPEDCRLKNGRATGKPCTERNVGQSMRSEQEMDPHSQNTSTAGPRGHLQDELSDVESDPTLRAAMQLGMDLSLLAIMTPGQRGRTDFSVKSLRFVDAHITSHAQAGECVTPQFAKPTASSQQCAKPHHKSVNKISTKRVERGVSPSAREHHIAKIEHVLARMKSRLVNIEKKIRKMNQSPDP